MPERRQRLAAEIQDVVAACLGTLSDPRLGFVSVVRVEVSRDLAVADIYVSVLGDDEAWTSSAKALKSATSLVRRKVAERVQLRKAPDVRWKMDPSLVNSQRIDHLLSEIHRQGKP